MPKERRPKHPRNHHTPQPDPLPPLPPPSDIPPLGSLSVTMRLHGPPDQVVALATRLNHELDLKVYVDACIYLPDEAWHQFPPNFLTERERSVVREDLRLNSTHEIANALHISTTSIHIYRSRIRSKFLSIEPALRPVWMQAWLRLYPGIAANRQDGQEGEAE